MDITKTKTLDVFVGLCIWTCLCGCQDLRVEARDRVKNELAERNTRRAHSVELCRKAQDACEKHDVPRARVLLNRAVTEDSRNTYAWMALGSLEFDQENMYEAAQAFHQAARLEPTRYEPHFNIGTVLESVGRYSQAINEYEAALKLAPNQVEVMENLARCYIKANVKLDKARELVNRALRSEYRIEWIRWLQQQLRHCEKKREANDDN